LEDGGPGDDMNEIVVDTSNDDVAGVVGSSLLLGPTLAMMVRSISFIGNESESERI
jgi:hypothetical protein